MAGTVTWSLLRELAGFRAEKGCAISLCLNLDPSDVPTAGDAQTRMNAMLHAADRTDRTDLTHEQRGALKADFERIATWFDDEFERDGSQGLAVFAAGLDNFWRTLALPEPVRDSAKVSRDFYVSPLVSLVSRGDGTIVAVVGREQGQLYRLRAGRLEEIAEHYDEQPGQHDQGGWSQGRYQRHIEKLVQEHLKGVAQELDRSKRQLRAPKIVLVCSDEMRSEFTDALSAEVRESLVGWTQGRGRSDRAVA
jgi:peptide chain release factor subunit 1